MRHVPLFLGLGSIVLASSASAMTVEEFVKRGEALQSKGVFAMFSSSASAELDVLRAEFRPGAKAWRAQVATAKPPVCAPAKVTLQPQDILGLLQQVPPAERATLDVKTAVIREMNNRYRCK